MKINEKRFYYITPEDEVIAEKNGITSNALYQRVHKYGWDIDKSITHPVRKIVRFQSDWIETAKKNGIKLNVFRARVQRYGWDEKTAATTPLISQIERVRRASAAKSVFTKDQIKAMEKMGLARSTVRQRVNSYGWSMEEALITPTLSMSEASKRARAGAVKYKKECAR